MGSACNHIRGMIGTVVGLFRRWMGGDFVRNWLLAGDGHLPCLSDQVYLLGQRNISFPWGVDTYLFSHLPGKKKRYNLKRYNIHPEGVVQGIERGAKQGKIGGKIRKWEVAWLFRAFFIGKSGSQLLGSTVNRMEDGRKSVVK